jgi:hypothetical protein
MPSQDFGSSTTWTAPFACRNVTATAIGGGGSGYKDRTDNSDGGGGGGGGFARSTRSVAGGTVISITVGSGGNQPGNNNSNNGGTTIISGGPLGVTANGGRGGRDGIGGSGGGASGDETGSGQDGREDSDNNTTGGSGGGAGRPGGNSGRCGNSLGGQGTNLDGSQGGCTGGRRGGAYGAGGAGNTDGSEAGAGGNGAARLVWDFHPPQINSFTASTQTNPVPGTLSSTITLTWSTTYASNVTIDQGVGGVAVNSGGFSVNTGLQSVAGSNSPAQRTYTITASGPGGTVTATATASVYNDGTPNDYSVPSQSNLEPSTLTSISAGTITGIDVTINAQGGPGVQVSTNNSSWAGSVFVSNNNPLFVRAVSPPFNTDPSGLTNSSSFYVDVGPIRRFFTLTTRAPDVNETFNYPNEDDRVPFPDIDTIPDPAEPYIISNTLTVDDIEIPVEIKTNNSNVQIRKKTPGSSAWGEWIDIRSI